MAKKPKPYWEKKPKSQPKVVAKVQVSITFYLVEGYLTTEKPTRE